MRTKLIAAFVAVLIEIILICLLRKNTKWSIETNSVTFFESMNKVGDIKYPPKSEDDGGFGGHTKQLSNMPRKNGRRKKKTRFPNAIIIGVKKGGTRALIAMLSSHPSIKISVEEVHYFSRQYKKGMKWYVNQMPLATEKDIVLEKSPSYFTSQAAVNRIYHDSKTVKLILILRNPIDRAISDYVHNIYVDHAKLPKFEKIVMKNGRVDSNCAMSLVSKGMYDIHFQRWLQVFNRSQILVLDGDQLITQPASVLKQTEEFLNIKNFFKPSMFTRNKENGFYCWNTTTDNRVCLGGSKGQYPHPTVDTGVFSKLKEFYKPHMSRFCELASVDFSLCTL